MLKSFKNDAKETDKPEQKNKQSGRTGLAFLPELEEVCVTYSLLTVPTVKIGETYLTVKTLLAWVNIVRYTVKEFNKAGIETSCTKTYTDLVNAPALDNDKQALAQSFHRLTADCNQELPRGSRTFSFVWLPNIQPRCKWRGYGTDDS